MKRRGEAGETLVEILVSTTLMGIIAIGIIGSIATVLISTDIDRKSSEAETVIRSYASAIARAQYSPCPDAKYTPSDVGFTTPSRYTVTLESVRRWDGRGPTVVTTAPATENSALKLDALCSSGADTGLQQLELKVESVGSRPTTEHLTVVKRDPAAITTTTSAP